MLIKEKIVGYRIYLKNLDSSNATKEYSDWLSNPKINKWITTKKSSIEELRKYIKINNEGKNSLLLGIFDKGNDKHIGNIKIDKMDSKKGSCEFGILIGAMNYWNRGVGTEASKLIISYVFDELRLKEITLGVASNNIYAIRLYENLGFIKTKTEIIQLNDADCIKITMVLKKKKILAIIQARMNSYRLPRKVLKKINNKSIIGYVIEAVKKSKLIDEVVLGTTINKEDKAIIKEAEKYGIKTFAGNEKDVLDRFYQAAKEFKGDIIVRITGDCPLHDPEVIDKIIREYLIYSNVDYVTNTFPPTYPDGFDVEVFSFNALETAWDNANLISEREHVTPYIRTNPYSFKTINIRNNKNLSNIRLTLDEKEDFELIKKIIKKLKGKDISLNNIIEVLSENPELININKKFKRNEGYTKSLKEDMILKENANRNR